MKKYFVVSDVHSFFTPLLSALTANGFSMNDSNHILVICGDLFDRGEESVDLLNFVKNLIDLDRCKYVRGNHEDLLIDCITELRRGYLHGTHHISNGTIRTLSHFMNCKEEQLVYGNFDPVKFNEVSGKLIDFVNRYSTDYFELDDYVFVHGWVPTGKDDVGQEIVADDWREYNWREARWENGMEQWRWGLKVPNKTVICGHFHCSWGWSHLRQERKEFPQKNRPHWKESFEPFIDDGIIALDACTAYTGFVNCIVIESEN